MAEREGFELSVRRWSDSIENAQRVCPIWLLGEVANSALKLPMLYNRRALWRTRFAPETTAVKRNKHDRMQTKTLQSQRS